MAKTVLLVTPEGQSVKPHLLALDEYGYQALTVHNENDATTLLYENPEVDLVLLDTDLAPLPDITRTARTILKHRDLPIVFLVSKADYRFAEKISDITSYGFLPKNAAQPYLIESINMAFKLFAAHQATKESEEKYRAAFMTSPDSININTMEGLYVDINEGFTNLTGYSRKEVIGKLSSDLDIWAIPNDRARLVAALQKDGQVEDLESVFRCKDGRLKTGLMSARIISLRSQPHILSITRDITNKKQVEEQLRTSEQRYRSIFDNAADGILIGNNQGIITDANISMTDLTGYAREELLGQSINMLFEPDILQTEPLRYDLVYAGTSVQRERDIITKSGQHLPVVMNTRKVEENVLQAIFHDVSQLRSAEQSLRESEERFRLAVEGSRDGLWDWNLQTNEAYHSDRFATMLGYDPEELPDTVSAWRNLLHPDDKELAFQRVDDYLAGKTAFYESTFRMRAKDGSYRWITGRGKALFDKAGNPARFVGFNTDITAQKEQEKKVSRLLEEKEFLLTEVTHRVKNNLAMISSLINLKQAAVKDKVDLSDLKHQINAIRIVHDKLHTTQEYSTIEFETYSRELLREIFSAPAAPPVKLDLDVCAAAIPVKTIIPLGLIINEIATNAIKYGFSSSSEAHFGVQLQKDETEKQYQLSLSNSGNKFEIDPTSKDLKTVGLQLVGALVDQIRGKIEMIREPDTTFQITFPFPEPFPPAGEVGR
mgnify:CR=1 FL=1